MTAESEQSRQTLDKSQFIREKLHGGGESAWQRYSRLVLARPGWLALLKYELIGLLGPIPGALGLAVRKIATRRLFAATGRGVIFGRSLTLRHADNIRLGQSVVLDDYSLVDARGAGEQGIRLEDGVIINRGAAVQAKVGPITIGRGTSVGAYCQIISQGPIEIAENVSIAGNTMISGGRYDVEVSPDDPAATSMFTGGPIRIGANVRIGMRSIILDGVSLGRNAIVAPGSVVFDDVPDDTVVIGCPARPLRRRGGASSAASKSVPTQDSATSPAPHDTMTEATTDESTRVIIRKFIEDTRGVEFGPGKLGDKDSLFDHGVIDSVGIVALITMLEEHFGVEFDDEDMVAEKLANVSGLAGIVAERMTTRSE